MNSINNLFTASERKAFSERWLLVKEIASETTQREIARKYNMSLCKITRGSKELRKENSAFRRMLELAKKTQTASNPRFQRRRNTPNYMFRTKSLNRPPKSL